MVRRSTIEGFVEKVNLVHEGKYDYSLAEYTDSRTRVEIICPKHGSFWQVPKFHMSGGGCPSCSPAALLTAVEFIRKAVVTHKDKYDYSFVVYTGYIEKVEIGCRNGHKNFWQLPAVHIRGSGCPSCSGLPRYTTEEFKVACSAAHPGKYTYDKAVYVNSSTKVIVTCPSHGDFKTTAIDHRRGSGCPTCSSTGYNQNTSGYFYILSDDIVTKVGITNRSAEVRTKEITRSSGLNFTKRFSLYFENGATAKALETTILASFRGTHKQPESIYDGSTESFLGVDLDQLLTLISDQVTILTDKP